MLKAYQKVGCMKTPNRVKPTLHVLDKLLWRHKKCRYNTLLEVVCPSKVCTSSKFLINIDMYRCADQDRRERGIRQ